MISDSDKRTIRNRLWHNNSGELARLIGLDTSVLQQVAGGFKSLTDIQWQKLATAMQLDRLGVTPPCPAPLTTVRLETPPCSPCH